MEARALLPAGAHRNGLSVDFMVPVLDGSGRSVRLPTGPIDKFDYSIDFDADAKYEGYVIDFEAMAEHCYQLHTEARAHGAGIALAIFDPPYCRGFLRRARAARAEEHPAHEGEGLDPPRRAPPRRLFGCMQTAMNNHVLSSLSEARSALDHLIANQTTCRAIADAGLLLASTFELGGRVFSCGNGGSMCDAMHFAEELSGRYRLDRRGLPATAVSDPGHLSCVSNDYGYEHVFSRYIEAHARAGDCLLAISTSGTSKNVVAAAQAAKKLGARVIGLTGRPGSLIGQLADLEICTPGGTFADRVQELHIKVIHILIELVERRLFPENYERGDG